MERERCHTPKHYIKRAIVVDSRAAILESHIQDKNRGFRPGVKALSDRRRGSNATPSITQSRRGRGARGGLRADDPKGLAFMFVCVLLRGGDRGRAAWAGPHCGFDCR